MQENADQKNSEYEHLLRSVWGWMKINGIFFIAWHKYEILFANMGKKESRESKIVALVDRGLEFSQFVLS